MTALREIESWGHEVRLIERSIESHAPSGRRMDILEAGCGPDWSLKLNVDYRLTGLDLDPAALKRRKSKANDLHETILGDLATVDLGSRKFDCIYCSFVLEHLINAETVLLNFLNWLHPNGIIVMRVPDRDSAQGFLTRNTPHFIHVLGYKFLLGDRDAGKPGHNPYRTYYPRIISPRELEAFCVRHQLRVIEAYAVRNDPRNNVFRRVFRLPMYLVLRAIHLFSFGSLDYRHTNIGFILQKRAGAT